MNEDRIIAAILTVAYSSSFVRDTVNHGDILHTYDKFLELLQERKPESVPAALQPLMDVAKKHKARRQGNEAETARLKGLIPRRS
jgi:hypothetical protein